MTIGYLEDPVNQEISNDPWSLPHVASQTQKKQTLFLQSSEGNVNVPPTDLAHLNQLRCCLRNIKHTITFDLLTQKSQAGTADPNIPKLHKVCYQSCAFPGRWTDHQKCHCQFLEKGDEPGQVPRGQCNWHHNAIHESIEYIIYMYIHTDMTEYVTKWSEDRI